jgi:uncharacterized protein YhfF
MAESITNPAVLKFWKDYLETLPEKQRTVLRLPQSWGFGAGAEMADDLGGLVVKGIKTATCSLYWEYEAGLEVLPKTGDLSIILDGQDMPMCLIETLSVKVMPFNMVDAQFAYDEGEGDRSLDYWRQAHWQFFGRTCAEIGRQLSEEMPVVCERFRVMYINQEFKNGKNKI